MYWNRRSKEQQARQFWLTPPLRFRDSWRSSADGQHEMWVPSIAPSAPEKYGKSLEFSNISFGTGASSSGRNTNLL
jgi:hypothetical protein